MNFWRLSKERWAGSAFDGEGARRFGGRWNSPGTAVVYASDSRALAALELLVHLPATPPQDPWVFFEISIQREHVETLEPGELPAGWNLPTPTTDTRRLGDRWAREARTPALRVPSVLIPEEWNLLLNPLHPEFQAVVISSPTRFHFDTRLI